MQQNSHPGPGPSNGPSPVKRSYSDLDSQRLGVSPVKRPCLSSEEQIQKEIERLQKKEAFLETQLLHLLQDLHKRYDDERQAIAEEQQRLANRVIEINEKLKSEEKELRERNSMKLSDVRRELAELQKSHEGLTSTTNAQVSDTSSARTHRGPQEDVANEVLLNSTTGREDVGSAAHIEHDLSTSQQSEVAQSSPEVHQQPNEESDGEISSSSDILILQAAGLLAEIGNTPQTGEQGQQCHTKDQKSEGLPDSSAEDPKEDSQNGGDKEKDIAITKLKNIGTVFEEELQCSICSELLVAAVTINCAHSFCKYCLGEWKKQRAECPMCRVAIVAEHRSVTLDSLIDTLVGQLSVELQQRHKEVQEERAAIDAAAALAKAAGNAGAPGAVGAGPVGAARQGQGAGAGAGAGVHNGRGGRGYHHNNFNWHPQPHPHQHQHQHLPPHHPYPHPHPHPPHAHAHPPHHAPPPLHAHVPPPHVPPPHALPPPAHAHPPHAHAQPARPPPGPADSPEHHLRVRRRNGRNILSSGSSSGSSSGGSPGSSSEEPSDSQSSYASSGGGYSNASDSSWYSAEYEEDYGDYGAPPRAAIVPGIPGRYYGGYGVCFYCNQRGHWSNGCPVRFGV